MGKGKIEESPEKWKPPHGWYSEVLSGNSQVLFAPAFLSLPSPTSPSRTQLTLLHSPALALPTFPSQLCPLSWLPMPRPPTYSPSTPGPVSRTLAQLKAGLGLYQISMKLSKGFQRAIGLVFLFSQVGNLLLFQVNGNKMLPHPLLPHTGRCLEPTLSPFPKPEHVSCYPL